ncbi:MAG: hypothetical protein LBD21_10815 [Tannerellaceae bacterium]|jgi:hypothetical protein|nr:hypothetical protein [Tannerellaceae bacterium]
MAVTKIRKISSWTLVVTSVILLVVLGLFLTGGNNPPLNGKSWYPKQTDTLLYWGYVMFGLTVLATVIFALLQFVQNFRNDAKKALLGLGVIIAFAALLFITYSIGSGEPIARLATGSSASYNVPTWLKAADMLIYSIYAMFIMTFVAIVVGSIKNLFK